MYRKIIIKIALFVALLLVLNVLYTWFFLKSDLQTHAPDFVKLHRTADSADVYYFGESSNTTFSDNDSIEKSISALSASFFPSLRFVNINHEATHAGIYRHWLHQFDRDGKYPRALIITMNLRSFDAAWIHSELENSLQQSLVLGERRPPLLNRFLLSLQAFGVKSAKEREQEMLEDWKKTRLPWFPGMRYNTVRQWDDAMAAGGHLLPDGNWNQPKIILSCHYIKAYAFSLSEKNPRVRDFDAINDWCISRRVPLYLNLMSENVKYADSLVGKELVFLMRQNRDFLVKRYNGGNCRVVDNLELVDPSDFIDQNWTTEHYNGRGRIRIAAHLADVLREQFKKEYNRAY